MGLRYFFRHVLHKRTHLWSICRKWCWATSAWRRPFGDRKRREGHLLDGGTTTRSDEESSSSDGLFDGADNHTGDRWDSLVYLAGVGARHAELGNIQRYLFCPWAAICGVKRRRMPFLPAAWVTYGFLDWCGGGRAHKWKPPTQIWQAAKQRWYRFKQEQDPVVEPA